MWKTFLAYQKDEALDSSKEALSRGENTGYYRALSSSRERQNKNHV